MTRTPKTIMTRASGPFFPTRQVGTLPAPSGDRERKRPATIGARRGEPKAPSIFELREKIAGETEAAAPTTIQAIVKHAQDSGKTGAEAGYILETLIASAYAGEIKSVRSAAQAEAKKEYHKGITGRSFEETRQAQEKRREAPAAAVDKLKSGLLATLSPEQKSWYDKQVSAYRSLMAECKARYKAELEKIKDKYGENPRKYTNERLKLKAKIYPDWSSTAKQAESKFEERQDKLADAISAAKKAGVKGLTTDEIYSLATTTPKTAREWGAELGLSKKQITAIRDVELEELYKPEDIAGTRVTLTDKDIPRELRKASTEEQEKLGIKKVDGKWEQDVVTTVTGQYVPATLFDILTTKQKAEVVQSPMGTMIIADAIVIPEIEEEPVVTIKATAEEKKKAREAKAEAEARGWWCYTQLYTFKATTKDGEVILVEAFDKASAGKKAKNAGYKVAWVTKKMGWETVEPQIKETGSQKVPFKDGGSITITASVGPEGEPTWAVRELEPYKDEDGNYDLIRIIEKKPISREAMKWLFGEDNLGWIVKANKVLKKLEKYRTITFVKQGDFRQQLLNAEKGYKLTEALIEGNITRDEAEMVFSEEDVNEAMVRAALAKAPSPGEIMGEVSTVSGQRTATEAEMKAYRETSYTPKEIGLIAADILIPFVLVARHWDELSVAERILWIAADIALFVAPMAAAGVRGARGAVVVGRAARLAGAAKGVGRELVVMVKGPITTVMHPVATTKQAFKDMRSLITNIAHPKKIPEAVLTTTEGTLRLRVTGATSADDFMAARDKLMKLAAKGERPLVQLKDKSGKVIATLELNKAPLMREVGGGVSHTTPWGAHFDDVLTVNPRPGMPVKEQGLFVAHEPVPRFATQSAFNLPVEIRPTGTSKQIITTRFGGGQVGNIHLQAELPRDVMETLAKSKLIEIPGRQIQPLGGGQVKKLIAALRNNGNIRAADAFQQTVDAYKPIFRIIGPDKADELVKSEKLYRGAAEIEAKFPVGTKIEPPKQVLFTHIGPEASRVEIWLDKPLSAKQIIKLKAEGLAEVFKQPFRTPLKVTPAKGAGLTQQQINQLASIIKASGNTKLAQSLERAYQMARSRQQLTRVLTSAGLLQVGRVPGREAAPARVRAERIEAARTAGRAARAEREEGIEYLRLRDEVERAERVGRAERPTRAERTRRVERGERERRPTRAERRERVGREERIERREREERIERRERTERPVRPVRPGRPVRPERPTKPTESTFERVPMKLGRERIPREGQGLVSWRQGLYYITVVEPYRTTGTKPDVIYSRERPPWARVVKGKRSPQRTLSAIGKGHPKSIKVPMGVVAAQVKNGRRLRFLPD